MLLHMPEIKIASLHVIKLFVTCMSLNLLSLMLHVLMEYPRLGLPLLLHWLPPGLDLRLSPHLRLGMLNLLLWRRLPLELLLWLSLKLLLRLPLELLLGLHRLALLELLWLSLKLLGLPLELLRLALELLWLALELLGLPLELALSRGRRVPHLWLPLIVLGVHARRGPLLCLGDEYHSRDRDER